MSLEDNIEKTERTPSFRKTLLAGALTIAGLATALFPSTAHAARMGTHSLGEQSYLSSEDHSTGTRLTTKHTAHERKDVNYKQKFKKFLSQPTPKLIHAFDKKIKLQGPSLFDRLNLIEAGYLSIPVEGEDILDAPVIIEVKHRKDSPKTRIAETTFRNLNSAQTTIYEISQNVKNNGSVEYRLTPKSRKDFSAKDQSQINELISPIHSNPIKYVVFHIKDNPKIPGLDQVTAEYKAMASIRYSPENAEAAVRISGRKDMNKLK
ncbi:MAG: hypothetical protein U9R08_04150 [Nanoarchaeota archaeon]|nr:hypothetical protein [Nanoarchaeota archaeon]